MSYALCNRRKDPELRNAIDRLHDQLRSLNSASDIYVATLQEIHFLTEAPLVFALEYVIENGKSFFRCVANVQEGIEGKPCTNRLLACNNTNTLNRAISFNHAIVLDRPAIAALENLTDDPIKLKQVLAIPLGDMHNARGLVCLANAEIPYHTDLAKRLWPLLATCTSLLRLNESRHLQTVSEKRLLEEQHSWRTIYQQVEMFSPMGMITLDAKQNEILHINPAAERMFGVSHENVLGMPITRLIPDCNAKQIIPAFLQISKDHPNPLFEVAGKTACGTTISIEVSRLHYFDGQAYRILLMLRDSTDLVLAQHRHEAELRRFQALADLAPMGILQTDKHWHTEYINQRWLDITGLSRNDLRGRDWMSMLQNDGHALVTTLLNKIKKGQEFNDECRILCASGKPLWAIVHAVPLFDFNGNANGFLATLQDNSFQHEAAERLREIAEKDALTGLANRTLFFNRLENVLYGLGDPSSLALLALDLDGFKNINDSLGHDAGDQMLVEVSQRLLNCVRPCDTVARVGGDEFYIMLEELTDHSIAAEIAEKVLNKLATPFRVRRQELFVTASIGISLGQVKTRNTVKSLLKQADLALYCAKDSGRNNYQYYSPELERASHIKLELGNGLHRALGRTEFEVYYQAQADIETNGVTGFEALLRWQHPTKGKLNPESFIPLLEESGLILPVSRWLFHISFQQLKRWIKSGLVTNDCTMAVNISPRQFRDKTLLQSIKGAISDADLRGENIVVEITETSLIQEHLRTREILEKLRAMGVKIALDDFGTGYSSLSYLKKFPIDMIKIDRSFVKDLLVDKDDAAITQAVIALAQSLGLKVLAEGVDKADILELLAAWGCHCYQGYLLNRPESGKRMSKIITHISRNNLAATLVE